MKRLIQTAVLFFATNAFSQFLICDLADKPQADTLKIVYQQSQPKEILKKSQNSKKFESLDIEIDPVIKNPGTGLETFSVTPLVDFEVDWEAEGRCFFRFGTQWYFDLNHKLKEDRVIFYPFYIKEYESCRTPRHRPQEYKLECDRDNF